MGEVWQEQKHRSLCGLLDDLVWQPDVRSSSSKARQLQLQKVWGTICNYLGGKAMAKSEDNARSDFYVEVFKLLKETDNAEAERITSKYPGLAILKDKEAECTFQQARLRWRRSRRSANRWWAELPSWRIRFVSLVRSIEESPVTSVSVKRVMRAKLQLRIGSFNLMSWRAVMMSRLKE